MVNKSGNGTFVDGEMLERNEERIIRNGAKIAILRHDLELFWYIDEKSHYAGKAGDFAPP